MKLPPYKKFPQINSDQVVLRQIQNDDIQDIVEISFYNSKPALTIEDAIEMQNKINSDYQNGTLIHWGIADVQTNKIVGTLGYYRGFNNGIGEIGCVLKSEFRKKGLMTNAMKLAIEYGLNHIGLSKIIAITGKENNNAIKLLERLHFHKISDFDENNVMYQIVSSDKMV
jgi:ribosomal-protein-alanine N-acetyltransferase